ncbi:MAG TPA: heat shock protein HspQ [Methylococcaceae bacterium]|nr:heat shock protein HspQ [Methylococcaceae bacterium]HIA45802.1 heat shock protein HspQ [Methylococcaceae bacterium]HIN69373.1 heat shock protein HspQ [Methylococcales bacterium]
MSEFKFFIGQVVRHRLFDYRGVIVDVDNKFLGDDKWYTKVAHQRSTRVPRISQ